MTITVNLKFICSVLCLLISLLCAGAMGFLIKDYENDKACIFGLLTLITLCIGITMLKI